MFRVPSVENYIDCVVTIEPDGQQSYGGKKWPPADPAIYAELRRTCVKKGATIWTNLSQKAQATKDVIEFLNLNLAR